RQVAGARGAVATRPVLLMSATALVALALGIGGAYVYLRPAPQAMVVQPAGSRVAQPNADDSAWSDALDAGTVQAFRLYRDRFWAGADGGEARLRIAPADERAWGDAVNSGTADALSGYLRAFPSGAHAAQAQKRLADLSAPPALTNKFVTEEPPIGQLLPGA